MNPFSSSAPAKPSTLITVAEFSELYAAASFALSVELPLSTSITLHWGKLGCSAPQEVGEQFRAFCKCLRDWLAQRDIPAAYIYSHETSERAGLHSHIAIHIPSNFGKDFLAWRFGWMKRRLGAKVDRAIVVRGSSSYSAVNHWLTFSYLLKGFDKGALVVSAANAPGGIAMTLGDFLAWTWRDPGHVALAKRVGVSPALAADQRELGYPRGFDNAWRRPHDPNAMSVSMPDPYVPKWWRSRWPDRRPLATPFRSKFEDGCRDVRLLYGERFYEIVTGMCASPPPGKTLRERQLEGMVQSLKLRELFQEDDF